MQYNQAIEKAKDLEQKGFKAKISKDFYCGYWVKVTEYPNQEPEPETPQYIEREGDLIEIEAKTTTPETTTEAKTTTPEEKGVYDWELDDINTEPETLDYLEMEIKKYISIDGRAIKGKKAIGTNLLKQLKNYFIGVTPKYLFIMAQQTRNKKGETPTENEIKKRYRKATTLLNPIVTTIGKPKRIDKTPTIINFWDCYNENNHPNEIVIYQQSGKKYYF
jgi:hypothetical protein